MFDIDVSQYGAENQQVVRVRYLYPADHPFAHSCHNCTPRSPAYENAKIASYKKSVVGSNTTSYSNQPQQNLDTVGSRIREFQGITQ